MEIIIQMILWHEIFLIIYFQTCVISFQFKTIIDARCRFVRARVSNLWKNNPPPFFKLSQEPIRSSIYELFQRVSLIQNHALSSFWNSFVPLTSLLLILLFILDVCSDITLLHVALRNAKCAHVCYNYQQIMKRENPSCWLDLSTMSFSGGNSRVQRVKFATRHLFQATKGRGRLWQSTVPASS